MLLKQVSLFAKSCHHWLVFFSFATVNVSYLDNTKVCYMYLILKSEMILVVSLSKFVISLQDLMKKQSSTNKTCYSVQKLEHNQNLPHKT